MARTALYILHRGSLVADRDATRDVRFRHADGKPYGDPPDARAADMASKLFSALRNLGFRDQDIRAVIHALREDDTLQSADLQGSPRLALQWLTRPKA